ncbi:MAG: 4Fe-4S ferredoxin [Spirochaetes bacterium]|nr:MAG: 4Fe-4S ferredoxin [Spirochaetota bacterium]
MRQKVRTIISFTALLLFPLTINWFSPYLIIDGASAGFINGSFLTFTILFLVSPFFGRLFCSWLCPGGSLQDILAQGRSKPYGGGFRDSFKYILWVPWLFGIILAFLSYGNIKAIVPFYPSQSIDLSLLSGQLIVYYGVITVFTLIALFLGKRAGCHSICWMAPFMILGRKGGNLLALPGFRLCSDSSRCTSCKRCTDNCPMSLRVHEMVKDGKMENSECILCARCADNCPRGAIRLVFRRPPLGRFTDTSLKAEVHLTGSKTSPFVS